MYSIGMKVEYSYLAGAISCQMNGKRIKGAGTITGFDESPYRRKLLIIDNQLLISPSEVVRIIPAGRTPAFTQDMRELVRIGKKTNTRRPVIPQPSGNLTISTYKDYWCYGLETPKPNEFMALKELRCPYGKVGDIRVMPEPIENGYLSGDDFSTKAIFYSDTGDLLDIEWKWKLQKLPSIFMPTKYGRTLVRYTDIHVERLPRITDADAIKEGVISEDQAIHYPGIHYQIFSEIWDSLYPKTPWSSNPWVWVIEWELLTI